MLKYDLHDSLIEQVVYQDVHRRVEMRVKLCNWGQSGYSAKIVFFDGQ